jgi:hypothetical protein
MGRGPKGTVHFVACARWRDCLCSPGDMLHGLADFRDLQVSSCFDDRSEFDAVVGSTGACESRPSTSQDTRHFSPRGSGSGPSDRRPQTMAVVPKKTKSVTVTDEASVIGRPKTLAASPPQGGHRKPRHLRALAKSIVASRCILAKSFEIHRVPFSRYYLSPFRFGPMRAVRRRISGGLLGANRIATPNQTTSPNLNLGTPSTPSRRKNVVDVDVTSLASQEHLEQIFVQLDTGAIAITDRSTECLQCEFVFADPTRFEFRVCIHCREGRRALHLSTRERAEGVHEVAL